MFSIIVVLSVLIATVVFVAIKENNKEKVVQKKCGCGKSESGYCDGSHDSNKENNIS